MDSKSQNFVLAVLFFFSGLAGLIYEVVWARYLSLLLGNTAHAHTVVLATFMGGLALGYYYLGRWSDRVKNLLQLYGWLEIGIGLTGGLFIPLFKTLDIFYSEFVVRLATASFLVGLLKLLLSALLILLPTVLMGGTLPVLSRFLVKSPGEVEVKVGRLYFFNSVGAVCGGLLAGLLLVPRLGLAMALVVAVAVNVGAGLIALALKWRDASSAIDAVPVNGAATASLANSYRPPHVRIVIAGAALSGCAALIYETAWIRLLSLVLGSSAYSFSLMLAAFISGIALGSFVVGRGWLGRFDPYLFFGYAELAVGLSIIATLPFYERLPYFFASVANLFVRMPETFWLYQLTQLFTSFSLMLLPTAFLGMTLPLASQVALRRLDRLGSDVGGVFAANTFGTLAGAVAAGLFLLPLLGIKRLIEVGVVVNLAVGSTVLLSHYALSTRRRVFILAGGLSAFVGYLYTFPEWDVRILSSGVFRDRRFYGATEFAEFRRAHREEVLYHKDGANSTVTINRAKDGQVVLKVNGKSDATTRGDLPTQIILGQLPMILRPDASEVMVIGFGSGITAGSVLRHPIARLDVVEISPEVIEGNRFFTAHNYDALKDPRLKLYVDDAKAVLRASQGQYDVIISEPSNPWMAGISNLFSMEFYREGRRRLKPRGLFVQWFHIYEMTDEVSKIVLRTFIDSFAHVTVWAPMGSDLILIGSEARPTVDFEKAAARFNDAGVKKDLLRIGMGSLPTLFSLQVASDPTVRLAVGPGRHNEDFFPLLEYEAPKAFFLGQTASFLENHDDRRSRRAGSLLYLSDYVQRRSLTADEAKDIASYLVRYGSLSGWGVARAFLELRLKERPEDSEGRWTLARLKLQGGEVEAALQDLERLLKADPTNREYLETAAEAELQRYMSTRSFLNHKGPERALGYFQRLLEIDGVKKERVYRRLAQIYAGEKEHKIALDYWERAASHAATKQGEGQSDILWLEAATAAVEMGETAAARAYLERALAQNPQNAAARAALGRLKKIAERGR